MFTGIIEEIGVVAQIKPIAGGSRITITAARTLDDLQIDQSVAVSGVCLTVVAVQDHKFTTEAVGETMVKSTLKDIAVGDKVNLERALKLSDRLGGHFVQGHVNGIGTLHTLEQRGENWYIEILLPPELERYVISEGSIAIDGISLTVARLAGLKIGISVIPYTYKNTTLKHKSTGAKVNIEVDFLAKYIEKFLDPEMKPDRIQNKLQWYKDLGY